MIPTANHQPRNGARVRLVVLHTSEGARDVGSLGRYFQTGTDQASYHAAFDDQRAEQYVLYSEASWSILSGNNISDNGCFCGFAAWDRAEWLRHPRMLELGAQWVAERCTARNLPIRRLSLPEVRSCMADTHYAGGVIMHRDYTLATGDGTHTDCGDGLPWDVILTRAQQLAAPSPLAEEDDDVQNIPISGAGRMLLLCPVGDASAPKRRAWLSAAALDLSGPGWVQVYAQGDSSGINDWRWTEKDLAPTPQNLVQRSVMELRNLTTKLVISWDLTRSKGGGVLLLETKPTV